MIAAALAHAPNDTAEASLRVSTEVDGADWDRFLERHPAGTVEHLWAWRHVFTGVFGQECTYLAARRDGEIVGVLPLVLFRSLLFGRSLVSLPYANYAGVVTSDPEAARMLVASAG